MQERFHVSWHSKFADAVVAKEELERREPSRKYQIRKRSEGRFAVVVRVPAKEILLNPDRIIKTRRPRRRHDRGS